MAARLHKNFRNLLKRLPESVAEELRALHNETGKLLLARMRARVAKRTGALSAGLAYSVTPKTLRLKVGLIGRRVNRRLFYGWIVERGRKGKTIIATRKGTYRRALAAGLNVRSNRYRRAALQAGVGGAYKLRVKPLAARPFVYTTPREQIYRPYRKLWGRAIHRAAGGPST